MNLAEKYRPKTLDEVIGQPKAVEKIKRILGRDGFDRDAFWIVGPSGTGKTSLARVIASMLANDPIDVEEIDGEQCTVDAVREAARTMHYRALSGGFRVFVINEAQCMTDRAVQAWLTTLEKLPSKVVVIFTTTSESADLFGEFDGPFRSRCKTIALTNQGLCQAFAKRAREVAQAEGLDGQPESRYVKLVQDCKNNMRMVLNRIESCEMME